MHPPLTHISPLSLDPERGQQILSGFAAIECKLLPILEKAFRDSPHYNLDHAQDILDRETRLHLARLNRGQPVSGDPALRSDEGFYAIFARWAGIHPNWPGVLLQPVEFGHWKHYYLHHINACNQAGFYLREVQQWHYQAGAVPRELIEAVNPQVLFCEVNLGVLIKYRWYAFTRSRFHKQGRLEQVEHEFKQVVKASLTL